jgi:hypothetical protein
MSGIRSTATSPVLFVIMAACLAASAAVQVAIDKRMGARDATEDTVWIRSGKLLKRLSLGQEAFLADIYWTRAVQYYGGQRRDRKVDFSTLYPLLDITTDLDPYLVPAYKFGAVFLTEKPPRGAGDPQAAVRLIKKGIAANPDEWRMWHDLGFIYYWELKDYQAAADAYLEGSKNPHAATWMKVMAAVILQKGNDLETSRFLWNEVYRTTEDPTIRQNALDHLQGLKAGEDIDRLQTLVIDFHDKTGQWPRSFTELINAGMLRGVPADPEGKPYRIDESGIVRLGRDSKIRLDDGQ